MKTYVLLGLVTVAVFVVAGYLFATWLLRGLGALP